MGLAGLKVCTPPIRDRLPEYIAELHAVRKFTTTDVAPVLLEHLSRVTFPVEIVPGMRELGIAGLPYHGYGCGGRCYLTKPGPEVIDR
ncbi:MAG: acyl-CoA dehydrogenase family protein [Mycobacterium sp.]